MDHHRALDILGIASAEDADQIRAARRHAARRQHPDTGGDTERMSLVNQAADFLLDELSHASGPVERVGNHDGGGRRENRWTFDDRNGFDVDRPSFVIDVLPVDAYEWLLMAARVLGQVVDDDPPYCLEVLIESRPDRWCRLEIVPDAGSSTVSITTSGHDPSQLVPLFVGAINELAEGNSVRGEVPPLS